MSKRSIINFLFILSFPVYGLGGYISSQSPSVGFLVSASLHLLIILFYCLDVLYKNEITIRVNRTYGLMLVFLLSTIASVFIAYYKGLPETTLRLVITRAVLVLAPFHSFLAVALYNEDRKDFPRLVLIGFSALLLLNLIGHFGFGLVNETHSIEGRINFPFLDSFYSGAGLLAVINLILIYYLRNVSDDPIRFSMLGLYFVMNMVLLYLINSRLTILIFLVVFLLVVFNAVRVRWVFWISLFTIPILLSTGLLLYNILKSPLFESMMKRVDVEDVVTFNGRSYLWRDSMDWLLYDQQGLMLGNGYKGHYFLDNISDVVKRWNVDERQHLHLHSTSFEILMSQGVIFFILYCVIFYRVYHYFRNKNLKKAEDGALFPAVVFLLFIMQVDTFVYMDSIGAMILALLVARASLIENVKAKGPMPVRKVVFKEIERIYKLPLYGLYSNSRT
jgi:hypothetical protein